MSNGLSSGGANWQFPALAALSIGLLGATVYQYMQLNHMRDELTGMKDSVQQEMAKLREASSVTTQSNRRTVNSLKDELEAARRQASMAAGQAKIDAQKHMDEVAKTLKSEQARQAEIQAKVSTELATTKETLTSAQSKIGEVSTEVGTVKTEVANTKTELQKTIDDLKSTRGDLGVQSGLIATNGKELAALRALGERNYFEFNLSKTKEAQKVGDVMVTLKKVDVKKNRYTIELVADDKRLEKKDKTVNEPVQFYVAKARQPYELVVNEVRKDQITGYLATPKVQQARN